MISLALWTLVLVRDVGVNLSNGWTIVLGLLGGVALLGRTERPGAVPAALVLTLLAMIPALIGGMGLLFLLPIGMMVAGTWRRRTAAPT